MIFAAFRRFPILLDFDMNESRCIALFVFPDPVTPVKTTDCVCILIFKRTLLARINTKTIFNNRASNQN